MYNKYELVPYLYLNNQDTFSDRMETLASEYLAEKGPSLFMTEDIWNDATAEQAYYQLELAQENNSLFYADDFFTWLLQERWGIKTIERR